MCSHAAPLLHPCLPSTPAEIMVMVMVCCGAMFQAFRLMCPPRCPPYLPVPSPLHTCIITPCKAPDNVAACDPRLPSPSPFHTCSVIVHCPDAISHTSAVESMLPLASVFPSGLNATLRTESVWPWTRCGESVQKVRLVSERMIVRFT